jgi:hypothetical protein
MLFTFGLPSGDTDFRIIWFQKVRVHPNQGSDLPFAGSRNVTGQKCEPVGAGNGGLAGFFVLFAFFVVIGFRAVPDLYRSEEEQAVPSTGRSCA